MNAIVEYIVNPLYSKPKCDTYILTACVEAIDIVYNQKNLGERAESLRNDGKTFKSWKE